MVINPGLLLINLDKLVFAIKSINVAIDIGNTSPIFTWYRMYINFFRTQLAKALCAQSYRAQA